MAWNPEHSMMTILHGEPLAVSAVDLQARLERITAEALAAKGWNQNQRAEARLIVEALDAMRREE